MEGYRAVRELGRGSGGSVWLCEEKTTLKQVALKRFVDVEPEIQRLALREARLLHLARHHPNVVKLLDAFKSGSGRFYLLFEYVPNTLCRVVQHHPQGLPRSALRSVAWQLLQALAYLHKHKVVHRDVKPANVLIADDGTAKLCDFGFAKVMHPRAEQDASCYVVTRWYRAPELLLEDYSYNTGVDIWALGGVFVEMATGSALFPGRSQLDQLWLTLQCFAPRRLSLHHRTLLASDKRLKAVVDALANARQVSLQERYPQLDSELLNFATACLEPDPAKRPSAEQLMTMPLFTGMRRAKLLRGESELESDTAWERASVLVSPPPSGVALVGEVKAGARVEVRAVEVPAPGTPTGRDAPAAAAATLAATVQVAALPPPPPPPLVLEHASQGSEQGTAEGTCKGTGKDAQDAALQASAVNDCAQLASGLVAPGNHCHSNVHGVVVKANSDCADSEATASCTGATAMTPGQVPTPVTAEARPPRHTSSMERAYELAMGAPVMPPPASAPRVTFQEPANSVRPDRFSYSSVSDVPVRRTSTWNDSRLTNMMNQALDEEELESSTTDFNMAAFGDVSAPALLTLEEEEALAMSVGATEGAGGWQSSSRRLSHNVGPNSTWSFNNRSAAATRRAESTAEDPRDLSRVRSMGEGRLQALANEASAPQLMMSSSLLSLAGGSTGGGGGGGRMSGGRAMTRLPRMSDPSFHLAANGLHTMQAASRPSGSALAPTRRSGYSGPLLTVPPSAMHLGSGGRTSDGHASLRAVANRTQAPAQQPPFNRSTSISACITSADLEGGRQLLPAVSSSVFSAQPPDHGAAEDISQEGGAKGSRKGGMSALRKSVGKVLSRVRDAMGYSTPSPPASPKPLAAAGGGSLPALALPTSQSIVLGKNSHAIVLGSDLSQGGAAGSGCGWGGGPQGLVSIQPCGDDGTPGSGSDGTVSQQSSYVGGLLWGTDISTIPSAGHATNMSSLRAPMPELPNDVPALRRAPPGRQRSISRTESSPLMPTKV